MKVYAICIVKNEVDILRRTIESAAVWADKIIIADHESNDGTWELINNELSKLPFVEVYGQLKGIFNDDLRGEIYRKYEYLAEKGDWWCRLDSDEIYIDNPKDFLSTIPEKYAVARCAKFQYYFTDKDLDIYNSDPEKYHFGNSIDNLKYYVCNESETRFFRHKGLGWNSGNIWPNTTWPNLIYNKHIRLKHFQYRYPAQIQMRIDIRSNVRQNSEVFSHEVRSDWKNRISNKNKINQNNDNLSFEQTWRDRVIDHNSLNYDDGVSYIITPELMTCNIRPTYQQYIRSTILFFQGKSRNITTR